MALTHALSTNNYGPAKLIVSTSAGSGIANGTHSTLASAISDAVSGDTIFLRDSVTENVTLTAGVNIAAWTGGTLNTPTITGTLSMTTAGTCNISGIRLVTNSAALLAVTGSAASIVNLDNCYLNCTNNTGITFSSSSGSSQINITNCKGDLGTTGIGLFAHSSSGTMLLKQSIISNSGGSSTVSTITSGVCNAILFNIASPVTFSSSSGGTWEHCTISSSAQNATAVTMGGSNAQSFKWCRFDGGSVSAISVGSATAVLEHCTVSSTNTNAITGSGTLTYSPIAFDNTSSTVNTSIQIPLQIGPRIYTNGGISFDAGTNLLANYATATWTPNVQINNSSTGITYTTQLGGYTRIGNVVAIWGDILLSSKGASTGNVTISNIPISTSTSGASQSLPITVFQQLTAAGYTTISVTLAASSTVGAVQAFGTGVGGANIANTNITNTFQFRFSGTYIID